MREVDHRAHPRQPLRDVEDVLEASEFPYAAHDLDAERNGAILRFESSPEIGELLDHLG